MGLGVVVEALRRGEGCFGRRGARVWRRRVRMVSGREVKVKVVEVEVHLEVVRGVCRVSRRN